MLPRVVALVLAVAAAAVIGTGCTTQPAPAPTPALDPSEQFRTIQEAATERDWRGVYDMLEPAAQHSSARTARQVLRANGVREAVIRDMPDVDAFADEQTRVGGAGWAVTGHGRPTSHQITGNRAVVQSIVGDTTQTHHMTLIDGQWRLSFGSPCLIASSSLLTEIGMALAERDTEVLLVDARALPIYPDPRPDSQMYLVAGWLTAVDLPPARALWVTSACPTWPPCEGDIRSANDAAKLHSGLPATNVDLTDQDVSTALSCIE